MFFLRSFQAVARSDWPLPDHGLFSKFLKGILVVLQRLWCCRCAEFRRLLRFVVAAVLIWGAFPPVSLHAETNIVPWGQVRETYNSNIWRRPKDLLRDAQGNAPQLDDFVTSVNAGLGLRHESRDLEAELLVGGSYNKFVHNTPLDFYAATLQGTVGLDRWVDQYVRGASLNISENLRYSPEQSFGRPRVDSEDLDGGLITFRRSSLLNTTAFKGSYPLSRDISLEGGYSFRLRRLTRETEGGDVSGATFFNTMNHTWHGGPRYHLTRNDSVAALYRQSFLTQERSEGGRTFTTSIITLQGDYTKVFQDWTLSVRGGVTFVEPAGRSFPSGSIQVSTKPERDTVLYLMLKREAVPSFFLQGGARIVNSARAGIRHRIYERLSVEANGGYNLSQFFPNTGRHFEYIVGQSRLEYMLTRNIKGEAFYLFSHINSDSTTLDYQVSTHQVGFMLTVTLESLGEALVFE